MDPDGAKPRILIVTPEIAYLPEKLNPISNSGSAMMGELTDFSAALVSVLYEYGADVHVALPDYRAIFDNHVDLFSQSELNILKTKVSETRIHIAQDKELFNRNEVYFDSEQDNVAASLSFQREVINIIFRIQPDLIHCNDWMTGLIPAMARKFNIPCLFTIRNLYNVKAFLSSIENKEIEAAMFWEYLYFERQPINYEETRDCNPVDFLSSGIFAADHVNTSSPSFLWEMIIGQHQTVTPAIQTELLDKVSNDCASGIIDHPDPSFSPETDTALFQNYNERSHLSGKRINKKFLQEALDIIEDPRAPLFYGPCFPGLNQHDSQLLAAILHNVASKYWDQNIEIVVVTNVKVHHEINDIMRDFNLNKHVAVCQFSESLTRVAYGASDFILVPSTLETVGLQYIIGLLYGTLPIAHDAGGIQDTIKNLDVDHNTGNGFLFHLFDTDSLFQAIDKALKFYNCPEARKSQQIRRIMQHSADRFHYSVTASHYIELYGKMLKRPVINH